MIFYGPELLTHRRKMRMKFNKSSQFLLVSAISLLAAGLITACSTNTLDFVYVSSSRAAGTNNYGEIDVLEINSVSGAMRPIPASPFPSGGRNPVAEAVSTDNANLYVVNHDDNTIVQFMIGSDGKLYPQNTVNTPGIFPIAIAVSGSNLFVVDTYQPLPACSSAVPCSGSVGVFPILPASGSGSTATLSGALGTPITNASIGASYWPLTLLSKPSDVLVPTAVNVLESGKNIYVTAYDATVTPNVGYVFGFTIGTGGALSPLNGGVPFAAGVHPSAIASDSTGTYVYVTDSASGNIRGYSVAAGILTQLSGSPFPAGNQPSAIVIDSSYLYAANSLDGNVEAYSIASGALKYLGGSATPVTYATGTQPVAMGIDPSASHFLFTANFLGDNVSNFELNATDGTLINTQHSPYTTNAQPTAVVAIPHGSAQK
jgi:6-phosphogluconolactonase (cycloisomerase 2 family)